MYLRAYLLRGGVIYSMKNFSGAFRCFQVSSGVFSNSIKSCSENLCEQVNPGPQTIGCSDVVTYASSHHLGLQNEGLPRPMVRIIVGTAGGVFSQVRIRELSFGQWQVFGLFWECFFFGGGVSKVSRWLRQPAIWGGQQKTVEDSRGQQLTVVGLSHSRSQEGIVVSQSDNICVVNQIKISSFSTIFHQQIIIFLLSKSVATYPRLYMSLQELDMEGTEFDPTIWIGRGKCYEKALLQVMLARRSVLEPPP